MSFPLLSSNQVVTLVLEREVMTLPRVSLSTDTDSISRNSPSPEVSQMRNNSCPAIITTPYTLSSRLTDYYFVSEGKMWRHSVTVSVIK